MKSESVLEEARHLGRVGDRQAALTLMRETLQQGKCNAVELQAYGRLIKRLLQDHTPNERYLRLLILGQCTTTWLTLALTAVAQRQRIDCVASDGTYDNVLQSIDGLSAHDVPDVLVLLPWHHHLLEATAGDPDQRVTQELAFWQQAWRLAAERGVKRLIQIGHDWIVPGAPGFHLGSCQGGDIDVVRRTNRALRQELPSTSYFVDLEAVSGIMGRGQFYDRRRQYWTRQPFSEAGLELLSEHIVAGLRALTGGSQKLLVVDLDYTLWGGLVGEVGALGIELGDSPMGEAYRTFQQHLLALTRRGVLLAACSKNNEADAREPFLRNPDMVLTLEDFAHFVATWEPKTDSIKRIAEELRIGLDSIVYFDDSQFERDMIRRTLPQVTVVDVPEDPSCYVDALQSGLWFESCALTNEDRHRVSLYAAETQRRNAQTSAGSVSEYLESLAMRGDVGPINDDNMLRVVQLLAKTNQFNLATRRHTADDVRRLLAAPGSIGLALRLRDRFVDHGLVALAIGIADDGEEKRTLLVDTFLMSCRVIGRTAEDFLMKVLLKLAVERGYTRVVAEYVRSPKNQVVQPFLERLGFVASSSTGSVGVRFELAVPITVAAHTFVAD